MFSQSEPHAGLSHIEYACEVCTMAKLPELGDRMISETMQRLISGHSPKHMAPALAALPMNAVSQSPAAQSAPVSLTSAICNPFQGTFE